MTTPEACTLIVNLARDLAAARRDRDTYYLLAERLAFRLSDVAKELATERQRRFRLLDERRQSRAA